MNTGPNANQLVQEANAKALQVVNKYYEFLDNESKRPQWVEFYMPIEASHPLLIWNGHQLATKQDITNYAQNLPKTKHTTNSIDAQPLMGNSSSFVVTVQGTVTYDENNRKRFFQRFTCVADPQNNTKIYISSDYVRWTGEA
jgi:hypothetical protein